MALSPIHFPNLVISFLILSCSGLKLVLLSPQTLPAVQTDFRVIWQRWRCSALQGVARVVLYTQALIWDSEDDEGRINGAGVTEGPEGA